MPFARTRLVTPRLRPLIALALAGALIALTPLLLPAAPAAAAEPWEGPGRTVTPWLEGSQGWVPFPQVGGV